MMPVIFSKQPILFIYFCYSLLFFIAINNAATMHTAIIQHITIILASLKCCNFIVIAMVILLLSVVTGQNSYYT
jgi:hypothetical protein